MKTKTIINFILLVVVLVTSCSSYNSIMRKAVKSSLGGDFKGYYAFSYPTNNFGLITTYEGPLKSENQYCAMVGCLDGMNFTNPEEWLRFGGLADVGDGGTILLSESERTKISVEAVLPKLWNALQIQGGASNEREVKTTMDIGPAHVRFLNRKKFEEYIEALPLTNKYKQKYNAGNLVLIVSDVVVEYFTVKIEVDNKLSARLDAEIKAGQIEAKLGKVDLEARLEKSSSGTYLLTTKKPVIVLRLAKKQSTGNTSQQSIEKGIASRDNFDDWEVAKDFIEN